MKRLRKPGSLLREESAVTTVEYALIAALIFVVIVAAVKVVGTETAKPYDKVGTELSNN
jgi:pilus assembly protein Flp/PilA